MNIYQKLIEVRKTVPHIKKDAHNPHFSFDYVSSNALINALRAEMDKYSLLLIPNIIKREVITEQGKQTLTNLDIEFMWLDADHPNETIKCLWHGQGLDSGEKGVGKALTYAEKYFLLKFFNIPTAQDDPDATGKTVGKKEPKKKDKPKGKSEDKPKLEGDITDGQADIVINQVVGSHLLNNFEKYRITSQLFSGMTKQQASDIIDWWTKDGGERDKRKKLEKQYKDANEVNRFDDWLAEKYTSDQKKFPDFLKGFSEYCQMPNDAKPFDLFNKETLLKQYKQHIETIKGMAKDNKEKK